MNIFAKWEKNSRSNQAKKPESEKLKFFKKNNDYYYFSYFLILHKCFDRCILKNEDEKGN